MEKEYFKLIHVAYINGRGKSKKALFLRKKEDYHFCWYERDTLGEEIETDVTSSYVEEAIRLARTKWKLYGFQTLNCGFRYSLPERDEHGINALFHQMSASYASSNGIYFDDDVGHNCIVHNASIEALQMWKQIR